MGGNAFPKLKDQLVRLDCPRVQRLSKENSDEATHDGWAISSCDLF
jgi:hypothetical protein